MTKSQKFILFLLTAVSVIISGADASAKDPLAVAPGKYKLLFENDQVRVMQVTFKPGDQIGEHSHPDHFVVVEQPGKLTISKPDGSSSEIEVKKDEVVWIPAETHWAKNTGKTTVQLIVTELKASSKH